MKYQDSSNDLDKIIDNYKTNKVLDHNKELLSEFAFFGLGAIALPISYAYQKMSKIQIVIHDA